MADLNTTGVHTTLNDLGLRIAQPELMPKVTFLGIANAPDTVIKAMEPVRIAKAEDIPTKLHIYDSNGKITKYPTELALACQEAFEAGARNVEVVVISKPDISGITNPLKGKDVDAIYPQYDASSSVAARHRDLQTAYDMLLNHQVDLVMPVGTATIDASAVTCENNFAYQLAKFCRKSTKYHSSCHGVIATTMEPIPSDAQDSSGNDVDPWSGDAKPSYAAQSTWVDALEAYDTSHSGYAEGGKPMHPDFVLGNDFTCYDGVTDAGGDGVPDNYRFWETTDGVMPTGSPASTAATVVKDQKGNPVDLGAYISVYAGYVTKFNHYGPTLYPTAGSYKASGAATYAGFVTTLAVRSAPTNKVLPGSGIVRNMGLEFVSRLNNARFVTQYVKNKGVTITDAMTGAYNVSQYYRSDYVRLTTVRITFQAIRFIRHVADPFIGEPGTSIQRNALETEIDNALAVMKRNYTLSDYEFELSATPAQQVLGEATLNLTLVPAFELRKINLNVTLSPPK